MRQQCVSYSRRYKIWKFWIFFEHDHYKMAIEKKIVGKDVLNNSISFDISIHMLQSIQILLYSYMLENIHYNLEHSHNLLMDSLQNFRSKPYG